MVVEPASFRFAASLAAPTSLEPEGMFVRTNAHFILNALHAVGALVRLDRADDALSALAELGDIQRLLVTRAHTPFVTVAEELELVAAYFRFERRRFGADLEVSIDVEPDVTAALVPTLILLPLVENAVKHGAARLSGRCRIAVSAERRDDRIQLQVRNNAPACPVRPEHGLRFGLSSVRERLAAVYGGRAACLYQDQQGREVTVRLRLPATPRQAA